MACIQRDHQLVVSVRDEGIGSPREAQEKLFTPFYRASRPEIEGIPGTGLGLAMVRGVVDRRDEMQGGQVCHRVRSRVEESGADAFGIADVDVVERCVLRHPAS